MGASPILSQNLKLYEARFPPLSLSPPDQHEYHPLINPVSGEEDLVSSTGHLPTALFGRIHIPAYLRHWASTLPLQSTEVLVVYGVGLGYPYRVLKEWLRGYSFRKVIFLEDDPELLFRFLEQKEAQALLEDPQAELYGIPKDPMEQEEFLRNLARRFLCHRLYFTGLPSYQKEKESDYAFLKFKFEYNLYLFSASMGEILGMAKDFYTNFWINLPKVPESTLFSKMEGGLKGIPAIIVGAGPSLGKQIPLLKTLKDRALIIAGGTAINVLNANGITPDLILGLDPFESSFSRALPLTSFEVPLIYKLRYHSRALETFSNPLIYLNGGFAFQGELGIEEELDIEHIPMELGTNVANASVVLAHYLGCDPLVTVGVDLAYSDSLPYGPGLKPHAIDPDLFKTRSTTEKIVNHQDIYGKPVKTLMKWVNESYWYGAFKTRHPDAHLINATEGGIGFPGVENQPLEKVASEWFKASYPLKSLIHALMQEAQMPEKGGDLPEVLQKYYASFERMDTHCETFSKEHPDFAVLHDVEATEENKTLFEAFMKPLQGELAWTYLVQEFDDTYVSFVSALDKENREENPVLKTFPGRVLYLHNVIRFNKLSLENNLKTHPYVPLSARPVLFRNSIGDENIFGSDEELLASSSYEGKTELWYKSGGLYAELYLLDGEYNGVQRYYFPDGSLKATLSYDKGKLEGEVTLYWNTGGVRRSIQFHQGKRSGKEVFYNRNGVQVIAAEYKEDHPIHSAVARTEEGRLLKEILYDDNGAVQEVNTFDTAGRPLPKVSRKGDYYDKIGMQTENLGASLEKVMTALSKTTALLGEGKEKTEVMEILGHLTDKMERLKNLGQDLARMQSAADFEIETGKKVNMQELMNQEIQKVAFEMQQLFQEIEFQVKDVRKKIKP